MVAISHSTFGRIVKIIEKHVRPSKSPNAGRPKIEKNAGCINKQFVAILSIENTRHSSSQLIAVSNGISQHIMSSKNRKVSSGHSTATSTTR